MPVSLDVPIAQYSEQQWARLTAEEYQALTESGILRESPVELLDGLLVWKDRRDRDGSIVNIGVRHSQCVDRLHRMLDRQCVGHGCYARCQQPIRISPLSVPEPDVSIVAGDPDQGESQHPGAMETLLVVEVSDHSLKQDREYKLAKYAAAGIPEYWIVDLLNNRLEMYRDADAHASDYRTRTEYSVAETVEFTLPDGAVAVISVARVVP